MKKKRIWVNLLVLSLLLLLLAGDISVLVYFGRGSWDSRVSLVLQIIGLYGIVIGFIQRSDSLKNIINFDELTSPEPATYVASNFYIFTFYFSLMSVSMGDRSGKGNSALGCLGQLIVLCLFPLLFLYWLFHMVVIAPLAYIGYFFTSALVESITGSVTDIELSVTEPGKARKKMSIKESIAANPVAAKGFLIGIPAIAISLILRGIGVFLQG
jgi:hypothetical protein